MMTNQTPSLRRWILAAALLAALALSGCSVQPGAVGYTAPHATTTLAQPAV
jgi:hypothetical protein